MGDPLVELDQVSFSYGAGPVLDHVSFDVLPGEVHVLAGENGAGKTTLIRILSGAQGGYAGQLRVAGAPRRLRSPEDARRAGIATIHQELSLVGAMSIADNLFLGRELVGRSGAVDRGRQREEAARLLAEMDLDRDPDEPVESCPIGVQQLVEIGKALAIEARVLIMDEPTSALSEAEASALFARIERLLAQGRGVVYISHRMEEIERLAHRITVLRDGARVVTAAAADLPRPALIAAMLGRVPAAAPPGASTPPGEVVLSVEHLSIESPAGGGRLDVDDASLEVRAGEIVGLAGLRGSGVSRLLQGVFGSAGSRVTGRVAIAGEAADGGGPGRSIERGVFLLGSDRKAEGLVPDLDAVENASLASPRGSIWGWLRRDRERAAASEAAARVRLSPSALDAPVRTLSGGNQQKAYLARALLARPRALLLDEPTRGVDVGAKQDIHATVRDLAREGVAVLLVTSDLEELLLLADRVLVMARGRIAARLARGEASRERVLEAAMASGGARGA